jgi:hypothetical protein
MEGRGHRTYFPNAQLDGAGSAIIFGPQYRFAKVIRGSEPASPSSSGSSTRTVRVLDHFICPVYPHLPLLSPPEPSRPSLTLVDRYVCRMSHVQLVRVTLCQRSRRLGTQSGLYKKRIPDKIPLFWEFRTYFTIKYKTGLE